MCFVTITSNAKISKTYLRFPNTILYYIDCTFLDFNRFTMMMRIKVFLGTIPDWSKEAFNNRLEMTDDLGTASIYMAKAY